MLWPAKGLIRWIGLSIEPLSRPTWPGERGRDGSGDHPGGKRFFGAKTTLWQRLTPFLTILRTQHRILPAMRPLVFLFSSFLAATSLTGAKELTGTYLPTTNECPSPEQARKKMTVPEGYEVRCFAHEPMVQNPIAMTWDHRGRLWVVEAYEYPNGSPHPVPFGGEAKDDQYHPVPAVCLPSGNGEPRTENLPRDRVIILEDTDNDGEADKRTVFVQGPESRLRDPLRR